MQYGINNIANNTAIIYAVFFFFFFFFAKQSYKAYQHSRKSEIDPLLRGAQSDTWKGCGLRERWRIGDNACNQLPLLPLALTPYGCHSNYTLHSAPPKVPKFSPSYCIVFKVHHLMIYMNEVYIRLCRCITFRFRNSWTKKTQYLYFTTPTPHIIVRTGKLH